MNDKEKITALRELQQAISNNTKADMKGKKVNDVREAKAQRNLLKMLLGREPEVAEFTLARTY